MVLLRSKAVTFKFHPHQLEVFRESVILGQQIIVLLEHQIVLYLEVLSLSQSHPGTTQLILQQRQVILEPVNLANVEVDVILGGRLGVYALVDFGFQCYPQFLGTQRHFIIIMADGEFESLDEFYSFDTYQSQPDRSLSVIQASVPGDHSEEDSDVHLEKEIQVS